MRALLVTLSLLACLALASEWPAHGPARGAACPYASANVDDGCAALAKAGHIGLYTVGVQDGLGPGNAFFAYARQSGQRPYRGAPGTTSSHPIPFDQAGGDYGIGPWTPTGSLINPTTFRWSGVVNAACSYRSSAHLVSCAPNGAAIPTTITGSIRNGVLTVTSGANPRIGQYVWYGVAGQGVIPAKIVAGSAGVYRLALPPTYAAAPTWSVANQTLNVSAPVVIEGFNFDDAYLSLSGTALWDIEDDRFTVGRYECAALRGLGPVRADGATSSGFILASLYWGYDKTCSGIGVLYPKYGATQASFNGTISGTALTINSGTAPSVGQYITGAAFTGTTQVIAGAGTSFTLSNAEPSLTEAMTSGPIQSGVQDLFAGPTGGGTVIAEYNYGDKVGTLMITDVIGPIVVNYNFDEIQGNPANHIDGVLYNAPGLNWRGGVVGATYKLYRVQDANTILYDSVSIAGVQNGGTRGVFAAGGGTANIPVFSTSGSANSVGGFYIESLYEEQDDNILIANSSRNNNTGTLAHTSAFGLYYDTQGKAPFPYYGSIAASSIRGNFVDPSGAFGCAAVSNGIYTSPGGSTSFRSAVAGQHWGADLVDGGIIRPDVPCTGPFH